MLYVTWDPRKNLKNQRKHGFSFEQGEVVLRDFYAEMEENDFVHGEQRYATIGLYETRPLAVIHTYDQENSDEHARIICVRKATPSERSRYERRRAKTY
jgi:uncharacterized protein